MLDESGFAAPVGPLSMTGILLFAAIVNKPISPRDFDVEWLRHDSIVPNIEFASLLCHLALI